MTTTSDAWGLLGRAEPWLAFAAVASFLVLFWILKGSPPGVSEAEVEGPDAPTAFYRNRVVAGVATGMLLIVLGAFLAVSRGLAWSLPVFAMGFGVVLTLITVNDRYRHVSPDLRRTVTLSRAALNTALAAGTLIVVNVAVHRYSGPVVDLTSERTYSLSSLSRNMLDSLEEPVVFHIVHGRSILARRQEDRVAQLLELYRSRRPDLIRIERLDRYVDLERGDELAKRSPELGMMPGGGVLIEYGVDEGVRFQAIGAPEMFEPVAPGTTPGVYASVFRGEDAVTSAVIQLRENATIKIGFTLGHGESGWGRPSIDGTGIERWKARLKAVGCEATPISLLEEDVPKDVKLLVIAGPKEAFKPQEAARLRKYIDDGGPILACLDASTPADLKAILKTFNMELGEGSIVDPKLNLNGRDSFVFCLLEPMLRHPVTDGIPVDRPVLLVNGAPIHFVGTKEAADSSPGSVDPRMKPSVLLRSGPSSWVESESPQAGAPKFDAEKDRRGPISAAVAVSERVAATAESKERLIPRLVLIGSRAVGEDAVVESEPTNLDLLMNAVSWLRGRPGSIGVPSKVHSALTLVADPGLRWRLVLAPTVVATACIAAVGGLVYLARRD